MRSVQPIAVVCLVVLFSIAAREIAHAFPKPAGAAERSAPRTASKMELVSPNGKHRIVIEATDTGAGIWLSGQKLDGSVSIYTGNSGTMVGVYSPGVKERGILHAAIAASGGEGQLQIKREGKDPRWLSFEDLPTDIPANRSRGIAAPARKADRTGPDEVEARRRAAEAVKSKYGPDNPASLDQPEDDGVPACR